MSAYWDITDLYGDGKYLFIEDTARHPYGTTDRQIIMDAYFALVTRDKQWPKRFTIMKDRFGYLLPGSVDESIGRFLEVAAGSKYVPFTPNTPTSSYLEIASRDDLDVFALLFEKHKGFGTL